MVPFSDSDFASLGFFAKLQALFVPLLLAWASGTSNGLNFNNVYIVAPRLKKFGIMTSDKEMIFLVASLFFGGAVGLIIGALIAKHHGRVKALLFGEITIVVFGALGGVFEKVGLIVTFRAFLGVGVGVCTITKPMFVSEITPTKARGIVMAIFTLGWTFGMGVVNVMDVLLPQTYRDAWRIINVVPIWPAVTLLVLTATGRVPESPVYLAMAYGSKGDLDEDDIPDESSLLIAPRPADSPATRKRDWQILRRAAFVGIVYGIVCTGASIAVIVAYQGEHVHCGEDLNKQKGEYPAWWRFALFGAQFIGAAVAIPAVLKLSRRTLVVHGGAIAICVGILAIVLEKLHVGLGVQHAFIMLYDFLSVIFVISPYFCVVGELFHPAIRSLGMAIILVAWFSMVVIVHSIITIRLSDENPSLCDMRLTGLFCSLFGTFLLYLTLPETKGVPIRLLHTVWTRSSFLWRSADDDLKSTMV